MSYIITTIYQSYFFLVLSNRLSSKIGATGEMDQLYPYVTLVSNITRKRKFFYINWYVFQD